MPVETEEPLRDEFPSIYPVQEQLRFLLRYAVLAPSTRNTQPWRFTVEGNRVLINADLGRNHRVADDDRRELYLSLGCAMENLMVAAEYFGFQHRTVYAPRAINKRPAAVITFTSGGKLTGGREGLTLDAVIERHTTHGRFADGAVSDEDTRAFRRCLTDPDLDLCLVSDPDRCDEIERLHEEAHRLSLADPAFRHELAEWVGAGGLGTSWVVSRMGQAALDSDVLARLIAQLDAEAVRHAPLLALISSREDDPASQMRSGQLLERIWLTAEVRGLGLQPLSAALEVPELRGRLTTAMGAGLPWAQQLVRIGRKRPGTRHRTVRRAVAEVLNPPEG
jgi:nitroreductase